MTDNIKHEVPLQLDTEAKPNPVEPLVEEAPASLFTEPSFPVDETYTPLSEEVEYPINDHAEELDQDDSADHDEIEEAVVQEDVTPVIETASKAATPPENAMPLRTTRRFQTVGNPEFKVIGVRPKRPSRFVTVGKDDYKTIKASISSMTDIYKVSPDANDENDKEREETVAEEEEERAGSPNGSHALEPAESSSGSAADEREKTEHPDMDAAAEEEEEFHTAIDDSETVHLEDKDTATTVEAPIAIAESSGLPAEVVSASRADVDQDAGPDL